MSSYGARRQPWGPHDWQGFYFFWKCVGVVLVVATVLSIGYQRKYPNVCEDFKTIEIVEKVNGLETLVTKEVCLKWKEYK